MNIRCTPSKLRGQIKVQANDKSNIFLLCAGALSDEGVTLLGLNVSEALESALNTLQYMGAKVQIKENAVTVSKNRLFGLMVNIGGDEFLFSLYCALAAVCDKGFTQLSGIRRLKKETASSYINALSAIRVACSFDDEDELIIWGGNEIIGGTVDAKNNPYLALALTLISCEAKLPVDIHNIGAFTGEFPDFIKNFNALGGKIDILK